MVSTPSYKLIYFPLWGLGETPRLILHTREWPAQKSFVPFGKLPVLRVTRDDGSVFELSQSKAIIRYLGRQFGLAGKTSEEQALVDAIVEEYGDQCTEYFGKFMVESEENIRDRTKVEEWRDKSLLSFLTNHERFLANNGSNGHYLGTSTTVADIAAYFAVSWLSNTPFAPLINEKNTPNLWKVYLGVSGDEKIQNYVKSEGRFKPFGFMLRKEGQVEL